MVVKNKKKSRKKLGYNHHNGLRRRGSGNRGGFGRAGQGKRCKQKKHKFIENGRLSYGKHGFSSKNRHIDSINLKELNALISSLKKDKDGLYHVDVQNKKVLANGEIYYPVFLTNYFSITDRAKEKIEKAGGKLSEK